MQEIHVKNKRFTESESRFMQY